MCNNSILIPIKLKINSIKKKKLDILFILGFYFFSGIAQEADNVTGIWWNDEKTTKIKVEKKYVWLENNYLMKLKGFVAGIRWLGRSSEWYRTEL